MSSVLLIGTFYLLVIKAYYDDPSLVLNAQLARLKKDGFNIKREEQPEGRGEKESIMGGGGPSVSPPPPPVQETRFLSVCSAEPESCWRITKQNKK